MKTWGERKFPNLGGMEKKSGYKLNNILMHGILSQFLLIMLIAKEFSEGGLAKAKTALAKTPSLNS